MTVYGENWRLFLVHWHKAEAHNMAYTLRKMGYRVAVAFDVQDVNLKVVRQQPPKAVIISLTIYPDFGREVAETLWLTNWGRLISTIFLDCPIENEVDFVKQFPEAIFTDWDTLPVVLGRLPDQQWE